MKEKVSEDSPNPPQINPAEKQTTQQPEPPRKGLINRVPESTLLMREGRKTLKTLQGEIKKITDQLKKGNMNPGIGNKPIGRGITESRTRGGARVYWRVRDSQIEILGISGKGNQQKVIIEVLRRFGG